MKKKAIGLLMMTISMCYSQSYDAPWLENNNLFNKKELTIDEHVKLFNDYWKTHDKNAKGSGHKPFMRWENYWRELATVDGKIMPSEDFWAIWKSKRESKNNTALNRALPISNWTPVGPFTFTNTGSSSPGQGRVNYICVDPSNSNTIYVGAPAGGIWKSTNAGVSWTALSDELPQIGVSGIAIDHTNPNTIYIATGDKDGGNTYSVGVLKSTDGGLTWNTTGLSFTGTNSRAGDLLMHPTNNQILLCATRDGLYKTTDAGANWSMVQTGNFSKGSIRFKPNDPTTIYAVSNVRFYKSSDSGSTFTEVTTGLPYPSTRLLLDVTKANPNYVYVLSATFHNLALSPEYLGFQGIYLSTDSGASFTLKSQILASNSKPQDIFESLQSGYDLALAVSPTNADEIYTGCLNIWKSTNGGFSFTKVNSWTSPTSPTYTHADIHFLQFYNNKLFCGSDGGIYVSDNAAATFSSLTAGLQIGQFYRLSVSKQTTTKMTGGLQDNGGYGYSNGLWKNFYGGDGMDTAIDPNNENSYYGFTQYGGILYTSTTAGNSRTGSVSAPAAEIGPGGNAGNWITPLTINNSGELFAGYSKLYILSGSSWVNRSTTSNLGTGKIEIISIDPSDNNIMYVVNGSSIFKSTDRGLTFTNSYVATTSINSLTVHSTNSNIVYVATAGTNGEVLKSTDGGVTFTSISTGLPDLSKNVIKHQGGHSLNPLYVGTTLGVYYRDDSMTSWQPFDNNLPNVSVEDLEINTVDKKLIAATYGRGIWQTDIPVQVLSTDEFELKNVSVFPNPSTGLFNIVSRDEAIKKIEVFDISGKTIFTISTVSEANPSSTIDLREVSNGIYFVKLSSDNQKTVKIIIKN
jgi:photosystem II stability/assembly factor-like uncharacterized protein